MTFAKETALPAGKTIVITGVSSGIGARTAELARAQGADIIGIDVNPPQMPMDFIKADLSGKAEIDSLVSRLPAGIDGLCDNAGLSGKLGAARTLAVNFHGLRHLTETLAPRLRQGGAVVTLVSSGGPIPNAQGPSSP